jgi:hypothetical protein
MARPSPFVLVTAAAGLALSLGTPSLAQTTLHGQDQRTTAHTQAQPSGSNEAGSAYAFAQDHRGQCWIPTGGGMNPNTNCGH